MTLAEELKDLATKRRAEKLKALQDASDDFVRDYILPKLRRTAEDGQSLWAADAAVIQLGYRGPRLSAGSDTLDLRNALTASLATHGFAPKDVNFVFEGGYCVQMRVSL